MSGKRKKAGASDDKPAKKRKPSVTAGATWHTVCRAMPKISFSKRESVLSSLSPPRRTTRSHKVTPKSTEKSKACHQDNSSKLAGSWSACSKTIHSASTSLSKKRRKDPNCLSPLLLTQKVDHPPSSPARKPSPLPSPVQKPSPLPSPERKLSPVPSPARKPSTPPSNLSLSSSCSLEFIQMVRNKQKLEKNVNNK